MALYQWHGWGMLSLVLTNKCVKDILSNQPWLHWSQGCGDDDIKDYRRFFSRFGAQVFRPLQGGRYKLNLAASDFGQLVLRDSEKTISLTDMTLIRFDEITMLYFHMQGHENYDAEALSDINRKAFAWQPRTKDHSVTAWENQDGSTRPLKDHIGELLGVEFDTENDYGDDVFGHELANCTWMKLKEESDDKLPCVSELSSGIDLTNPRYKLAEVELDRLRENQFSYWYDWRCQLNLTRLIFVDDTVGESSPLESNLKKYQYYLDLFALVLLQKNMLSHFKEQLVLSDAKHRKGLYRKIEAFRRGYKVSQISTYPFANKLYNYFYEQAELDSLEEKTFTELEYSHSLWREEREEMGNTVMLLISLIAAILLPASSVATIFALTESQMNETFWVISAIFTVITLLVIMLPVITKKRTSKKAASNLN